jgi:putative ABC transport system ATP-binding protein
MLKTKSLKYKYTSGTELSFPDLECANGSHWLILGRSGTGKTTFLHLLAGLRTPTSGDVIIQDQRINRLNADKLDQFRGRYIGIVFQEPHFIRSIDVQQNILMAQRLAGKKLDRKRVVDLLEELGLGHKINSRVRDLSVGERQRVAIARAIVNKPELILADEPTSALDDENAMSVIQLLKAQAESVNAVLLIVTHDQRLKEIFQNSVDLKQQMIGKPN